jgi:hypothetical protein
LKILFVYDNSIGVNYLRLAMQCVDPNDAEITVIKLSEYPAFDDSGFDGLIYNTFPDENHPHKFRKDLVNLTDEKLKTFKGKILLFDSHDEGHKDAFSRFIHSREEPRIKAVPCRETVLNTVIPVPFSVNAKFMDASQPRTIPLLYCARLDGYPHDIRKQVFNILKPFNPFTQHLAFYDYIEAMKKTKISVVAPGWGVACVAHLESLAAGALLLAHESIRETKLLPFADLTEDKHYVLYNLDNLAAKVNDLLARPNLIAKIAKSGNKVFERGYNLKKTANQVLNYFRQEAAQ